MVPNGLYTQQQKKDGLGLGFPTSGSVIIRIRQVCDKFGVEEAYIIILHNRRIRQINLDGLENTIRAYTL